MVTVRKAEGWKAARLGGGAGGARRSCLDRRAGTQGPRCPGVEALSQAVLLSCSTRRAGIELLIQRGDRTRGDRAQDASRGFSEMDEDLYDEFGNYIGPDLDDDDASGDEWLEPLSKVRSCHCFASQWCRTCEL